MRYFQLTIVITVCFFSNTAFSLSCGPNWNEKIAFEKAERFFVVKVTSVSLDPGFLEKLKESSDSENSDDEEPIVINTYQYEVIENLKGKSENLPKIYSVINIGAGSANLMPGAFYLLSILEGGIEFEGSSYDFLTYCDVHAAALTSNNKEFLSKLETIRNLAKK